MSHPSALSQPAVVAGEIETQVEEPAIQGASIKAEISKASADSAWHPASVDVPDPTSSADESDPASSADESDAAFSVDGSGYASSGTGLLPTESSDDDYMPETIPARSSKRSRNFSAKKQGRKRRKIGERDSDEYGQKMRVNGQKSKTGAPTKKTGVSSYTRMVVTF
jgi:hypothetical protein